MLYRRYPLIHRKYAYPSSRPYAKESEPSPEKEKLKDAINKDEKIPLPNELEHIYGPEVASQTGSEMFNKSRESGIFGFLKLLPKKIHLEEVIIIGLIFLLLNEEIKDDILLLILIYILLT
ncbi:MAG TPA: hypothetical protein GX527_05005 [Clostridiaceae bacterium]|nr:hypothetical protein [Clostridiaceae bacterium]